MIWLFRLFVVSPMAVIYFFHEIHNGLLRDRVSSVKWFGATLGFLGVMWLWDVSRKPPRTLPSVIITRMLIVSMLVFSFIPFLFGNWFFWYILSHSVVWMCIWLQLFIHRVGHHFVYPHDPNGNYYDVRRAGWHQATIGPAAESLYSRWPTPAPEPASSRRTLMDPSSRCDQPPKLG
jgi:hypothetical protein